MKIFENFNTAKHKYGISLVDNLTKLGVPPQFLLSACRFVSCDGIPMERVACMFKEWIKYVVKYNRIDVNTLTYEQFYDVISNEKHKHCIPNVIFYNETASIGKLLNAKDVQKIPVKNMWCIKSQQWFDKYNNEGYKFYVIYLPSQSIPSTFVIASIHNGNVEYYNSNDMQQNEPLVDGYGENEHEKYQSLLPSEIKQILYNNAAEQTEDKEQQIKENKNTRNMEKQTIRLNESQLRQIVKESVKNILNESYVWYGYVKPLKAIIAACYEITNKCKDYDFDDYESVAIYDLFRWAQQISDEAENFIEHNSDNVSIDY